ncbi:MAG: phage portal protein [Candidatus Aenigmatarchaeota archaeon]
MGVFDFITGRTKEKDIVTEKAKTFTVGTVKSFATYSKNKVYEYSSRKTREFEHIYRYVPLVKGGIRIYATHTLGRGFSFVNGTQADRDRLERFSKRVNLKRILFDSIITRLVYGNAYYEIIKEGNRIVNLKYIDPSTITIVRSKHGELLHYNHKVGMEKKIKLDPEEVLHFTWDKFGDSLSGNSMIESISQVVNIKLNTEENIGVILYRYASPIIVFKLGTPEDPITSSDVEDFEDKIQELDPDEDIVSDWRLETEVLGVNKEIMKPDFFLKHIDNQILAGLQVPSELIYSGEKAEKSARSRYAAFEQNVWYLRTSTKEELYEKIFDKLVVGKEKPDMMFEELEEADEVITAQRLVSLKGAGIITGNEARDELGKDPLPGLDEIDTSQPEENPFDDSLKKQPKARDKDVIKKKVAGNPREFLEERYGKEIADDIIRNIGEENARMG